MNLNFSVANWGSEGHAGQVGSAQTRQSTHLSQPSASPPITPKVGKATMNSAASSIVLNDQAPRVEVSGYVLTETFRPPSLVFPSHFHDHANIGLTVDGCFTETVGPMADELKPSCVAFRPAGEKLLIGTGRPRLAA